MLEGRVNYVEELKFLPAIFCETVFNYCFLIYLFSGKFLFRLDFLRIFRK